MMVPGEIGDNEVGVKTLWCWVKAGLPGLLDYLSDLWCDVPFLFFRYLCGLNLCFSGFVFGGTELTVWMWHTCALMYLLPCCKNTTGPCWF